MNQELFIKWMGLASEHSNNTAFEHHFLIAYFCLHNQSSNKKMNP